MLSEGERVIKVMVFKKKKKGLFGLGLNLKNPVIFLFLFIWRYIQYIKDNYVY